MNDLIRSVRQLESLVAEILEAVERDDMDTAVQHLEEYGRTKKEIKLAVFDDVVISLPGTEYKDVRTALQLIKLGKRLPFEKIFAGTGLERIIDGELSHEEVDELSKDQFYSWFSGLDYVQARYEAFSLISAVDNVPDELQGFLDEVRECYVFQRHQAVYALCRTALEIAVRHHYEQLDLHDLNSENRIRVENRIRRIHPKLTLRDFDPDLYQMTVMLTALPAFDDRELRRRLHSVRDSANRVIHNLGGVDLGPTEIMAETFDLIHRLYEIWAEEDG